MSGLLARDARPLGSKSAPSASFGLDSGAIIVIVVVDAVIIVGGGDVLDFPMAFVSVTLSSVVFVLVWGWKCSPVCPCITDRSSETASCLVDVVVVVVDVSVVAVAVMALVVAPEDGR